MPDRWLSHSADPRLPYPVFELDSRGGIWVGPGTEAPHLLASVGHDFIRTRGQLIGRGGIGTRVLDGPPTDAVLARVEEGVMLVDRTNLRLWVKVGSEWRYAQLI